MPDMKHSSPSSEPKSSPPSFPGSILIAIGRLLIAFGGQAQRLGAWLIKKGHDL